MNEYYVKVRAATDEAMDAFHKVYPEIPRNLHPYTKTWGETRVTQITGQRMEWVNQYLRENYPELFHRADQS